MSSPEQWVCPAFTPRWDIEGTAAALHADLTLLTRSRLGKGVRLTMRETERPTAPQLDLFPTRLVIRLRSRLTRLEFADVDDLWPERDYVRLGSTVRHGSGEEVGVTRALVYADGSLALMLR